MASPISGNNPVTIAPLANPPVDSVENFVTGIKAKELLLSANCKTDIKSANAYLYYLVNLQRFEDAYKTALEISEFIPKLKDLLATFAVFLNDPDLVKKHVNTLEPAPDAPVSVWLSAILYHHLVGTIDELIVKAHPNDRTAKALLFFLAEDNFRLYKLLFPILEDLNDLEHWFVWSACCRLEFKTERNLVLDKIIAQSIPLPFAYYKRILLDELVFSSDDQNRPKIATFLTAHHLLNPECIKTMVALMSVSDTILAARVSLKLKRLVAAFPNLDNKVHSIISGSSDHPIKTRCLYKLYKDNPSNKNLHCYLTSDSHIDFDTKVNVIQLGMKIPCLYFHLASIEWCISNLEKRFAPDIAEELLDRINEDLKLCPHHRILLIKKGYLLVLLKKHSEAVKVFQRYVELFGITMDLIETLDGVSSILIDPFVLSVLREAYDNLQTGRTREALKRAYVHQNDVKGIEFILKTMPKTTEEQCHDFESIEQLLLSSETTEGELMLEGVLRIRENYTLILLIAHYYADIGHKKALDDIEFIKRFSPPEAKKISIIYLANSERCVDAANELIASKVKISNEFIEFLISQLNELEEHKLVDELVKKTKPQLCNKARKVLANSYYALNQFQDALSVYKVLLVEDPEDVYSYIFRANCYEKLNMMTTALDVIKEGIEKNPTSSLLASILQGLEDKQKKQINSTPIAAAAKPAAAKARPAINTEKLPYLIQDSKQKEKRTESFARKGEKVVKVLQDAPAFAIDPLADPLAKIKEIARMGETQTGPKPKAPAPEPVAAVLPRTEAPKAIVKINLTPRQKVFIKRGLDALNEVLAMKEALLEPDDIFRNHVYAILRVFIPLRLNSTHPALKNDLKRIRDNARHETDQISHERLAAVFAYLKSINLSHQMNDWIREKSIITRLMLNNHIITIRKPKKTPLEKVIAELEYIVKKRGEKATWNDRLYHRNAIKASLSIIGEASNFLPESQKSLFPHYRDVGNTIAHEFFEEGDTVAFLEKYKEEDISPEALWNLIQDAEILLKKLALT